MKKLLSGLARPSTFIPVAIIGFVSFVAAVQNISQDALAVLINGVAICMSIMVVAAYGPGLFQLIRSSESKKDQYLVSGIVLLWAGIGASRLWSMVMIVSGHPPWMMNHWFQTFCYFVIALSGLFFLKIPGNSFASYRYMVMALLGSVTVATMVLALFER